MSTSVVVAIITGIATMLAPVLVKVLERDRREEIDKELKILGQMNPESVGYEAFSKHVEKSLLDFAENDWLRSQYRNAYQRYIALFLLLACLFLLNSWFSQFEDSAWFDVYQIVRGVLYLLAAFIGGSILTPLIVAMLSEFQKIRIEWELKIKSAHVGMLEKYLARLQDFQQQTEGSYQDLLRIRDLPESKEQEHANIYNTVLWWALRGAKRDSVVQGLKHYPVMYETDAEKVGKEAFDYFDEWAKRNEVLEFIEDSRES